MARSPGIRAGAFLYVSENSAVSGDAWRICYIGLERIILHSGGIMSRVNEVIIQRGGTISVASRNRLYITEKIVGEM